MKDKILLIDDEVSLLKTLKMILEKSGFDVIATTNASTGFKVIKENINELSLIITDLALPGGFDGFFILDAVKELRKEMPVIMITAYGDVETAVKAMQKGAFNFMTKPIANFHVLIQQVKKAIETANIKFENERLKRELEQVFESKYKIVYKSEKIKNLLEKAKEIAQTDETVLITGQSGTGKELLARFILKNSKRANNNFIAFNAAAVNEHLMESELFGHLKGAFTGAETTSPGYVGSAQKGTLFIDEIGEMPLSLQSKFLRFLQEKEYLPVGSSVPLKADVRIIAATNKNLEDEMKKGNFRQDLFYRLSVFPLNIPPLKQRKEDIPELIDFFYEKWCESYKKKAPKPTVEMKKLLMKQEWQGNVRELENLMARYVLYSGNIPELSTTQKTENFEKNIQSKQLYFELGKQTLKEMESTIIKKALKYANGNKKVASEILGISERTIYRNITEDEE